MLPGLYSTQSRYMGVQYIDEDQHEFLSQEVFLAFQVCHTIMSR